MKPLDSSFGDEQHLAGLNSSAAIRGHDIGLHHEGLSGAERSERLSSYPVLCSSLANALANSLPSQPSKATRYFSTARRNSRASSRLATAAPFAPEPQASLADCSRCQLVSSGARLDMVCDPRPRCLGAFKPGFDHGIAAPLDDGEAAPVLDDPDAGRSAAAAGAAAHI